MHLFDVAPDHHADDRIGVQIGGWEAVDETSVTQNRDPVGDAKHFLQPMRNEDDPDPVGLEVVDNAEKLIDLTPRQRRRRLVHDEDRATVPKAPWRSLPVALRPV